MANTKQFKDLQKRLAELRKHLLPKNFSPTGNYSERVLDRARGYRLLAHAEIEAYLEEIALETIDAKIDAYKSGKPSYILLCFVAGYHRGWVTDESQSPTFFPNAGQKPQDTILEAIKAAQGQYKKQVIQSNNGIKIADLQKMFLPLGVDFSDPKITPAWLGTVESYGKQRGVIAHQAKKIQKPPDPQDELNTLTVVIDGLRDFDELIGDLIKL